MKNAFDMLINRQHNWGKTIWAWDVSTETSKTEKQREKHWLCWMKRVEWNI